MRGTPVSEVREQRVDAGGVVLWTAVSGSGAPLVLAPGGPGCCDYLAPVAKMLDDLAEVVRFDPRGCGRSDAAPPYTVASAVADLDGLRAALGHAQWIVGGHSWGANLGLAYALAHPERTRALLYVAGNGAQNDRDWHDVYVRLRASEVGPSYPYPPNLDVNSELNASWRAFIRRPSLWRELGALRVPALVLIAGRDIRPSWPAEQIAGVLPAATVARIPEAAHFPWLGHAAELRRTLRDFVAPLVGSAEPRASV
jgi:proline iminopeptidase